MQVKELKGVVLIPVEVYIEFDFRNNSTLLWKDSQVTDDLSQFLMDLSCV